MMGKQIGNDDVAGQRGRSLHPFENVGLHRLNPPAKCGKTFKCITRNGVLPIHEHRVFTAPARPKLSRYTKHKMTITRADFDESLRRMLHRDGIQGASDNAGVSHPIIEHAQVAARTPSFWIQGGQAVEPFRFYNALHPASLHLEQGAMSAETSAKRGQPPVAAWARVG